MKYINQLLFLLLFFFTINTMAQEDTLLVNQLKDGLKVGKWEIYNEKKQLIAEGNYEQNLKEGRWKYYLHSTSQYTNTPDIKGEFQAGLMQGKWEYTNPKTGIKVIVEMVDGKINGVCKYYDAKNYLLAKGLMRDNIRHGKWFFYFHNKKMGEGFYKEGQKIDRWEYDYKPDSESRVVETFDYKDGEEHGQIFYYKILDHPVFGREELLKGTGKIEKGIKTGRWVEYDLQRLGQESIKSGSYNNRGKKVGQWKTIIDGKVREENNFNNGLRDGSYRSYYNNGKLQKESYYENGLETGFFSRYLKNGKLLERGQTILLKRDEAQVKDTIFYKITLPYTRVFQLIENEKFKDCKLHYIHWISNPDHNISPVKLQKGVMEFFSYGLEDKKRIIRIEKIYHQSVRTGAYVLYHENGQIKMEGNYYPIITETKDIETGTTVIDFARDGIWKRYSYSGYLQNTYQYKKGKLLKILDNRGQEGKESTDKQDLD